MKSIRMATPKDAAQLLTIYAPYILQTTTSFELEVPTEQAFGNRIEKYLLASPWLVCEQDKQIIGYAYASPHRGRAAYQWNREVSAYVHADFHRLGIAKILYEILFELLRLQGYANVLAGIVAPNAPSVHFHTSMGFQHVGTYRNIGFKMGTWKNTDWYEFFLQPTDFIPTTLLSTQALMELDAYQKVLVRGQELLNK